MPTLREFLRNVRLLIARRAVERDLDDACLVPAARAAAVEARVALDA